MQGTMLSLHLPVNCLSIGCLEETDHNLPVTRCYFDIVLSLW